MDTEIPGKPIRHLRIFFSSLIGMASALVLFVLIAPEYSNYHALSETEAWLNEIVPAQYAIEAEALRLGTLEHVGKQIVEPVFSTEIKPQLTITDSGTILLQGGSEGQFLALIPSLNEDGVRWTCHGGSANAVPKRCEAKLSP